MKNNWKKAAAAALSAALLLGTAPALAAETNEPMALQVNGENVVLTDAAPRQEGEILYVPLRAVMEAMGYQADAADGVIRVNTSWAEIIMTPGSTEVTMTYNDGEQDTVTLDAPVYVDSTCWRTFVPLSFMEDVLYVDTGYDAEENTAIVADVVEILIQVTEGREFDHLKDIMCYEDRYEEGIWDVDMKADGYMTTEGCKIPLSANLSGIAAEGSRFQIHTKMTVDMREYAAMEGEKKYPITAEVAERLATEGLDNEVRADQSTGECYIQANGVVAEQMAGGVGTWYKMTSGELSKRFGLDTSSVSSFMAPMGYDSMADIGDLFASESDFDHVEDYSLVAAAMDRAFGNFCDASFVLEGDTWVLDFEPVEETGIDHARLTVTMDGETVTGCAVSFDFSYTDAKTGQQVRVIDEKNFVGDTETSRVQGWRDGKQVRDINRTVTYKPGTTAPKTVPDEGANVASLIDVLKAAE